MKKENGFTLIELLAVIVILVIIALIATPLTINVINKAKEKAFINTAYGLIDGARLLSVEQQFKDETAEVIVEFTEGVVSNTNFKVSGDMPNSGTIHLTTEEKVELKVWSEELGKCAEKSTTESEVKITETTKEECKIEVCPLVTIMGKNIHTCETMTNDPDGNLRYVGTNPNNYVWFNKERWRIIGVFNGQTKIIRNEDYSTSIAWDEDDGDYSNNWATASLQLALNNETDGYIKAIETNDPTSYSYIDLEHVWNIGGATCDFNSCTRSKIYNIERGTTPVEAEGAEATWEGTIGLMYVSDYGYSTNGDFTTCDASMFYWDSKEAYAECAGKSWLYDSSNWQWTLNSGTCSAITCYYKYYVLSVGSGYVYDYNLFRDIYLSGRLGYLHTYEEHSARPVLFLKSDTKIMGGQGTYNQPYELAQ